MHDRASLRQAHVQSDLYWIRYFIVYHDERHPREIGAVEVEQFLTILAASRRVSMATQKVAPNVLAFLYNRVLRQPFGDLGNFNCARRSRNLPVVLNRAEAARLLARLTGASKPPKSIPTCSSAERGVRSPLSDLN